MSEYLQPNDYDGHKIRTWLVERSDELEELKRKFDRDYFENGVLVSLELLNQPSVAQDAERIMTMNNLLGSLILTLGDAEIKNRTSDY
ncbi:hypothetical protein KC867_00120 [Candidatus Saccharibacteria bacterium]|nr:hypothetical protein [Candidatus Saccharibacteria bacterium]